jgi:hypothetical protein
VRISRNTIPTQIQSSYHTVFAAAVIIVIITVVIIIIFVTLITYTFVLKTVSLTCTTNVLFMLCFGIISICHKMMQSRCGSLRHITGIQFVFSFLLGKDPLMECTRFGHTRDKPDMLDNVSCHALCTKYIQNKRCLNLFFSWIHIIHNTI